MLVRFIIVLIVIYLLYRVARGLLRLTGSKAGSVHERTASLRGEDLVEDPLCHTLVPISLAYEATMGGVRHYFCSKECCEKYRNKMEAGKAGN